MIPYYNGLFMFYPYEENKINYTFPSIKYATDNAAMIASSGYYAFKLGRRADLTLNPLSTDELK